MAWMRSFGSRVMTVGGRAVEDSEVRCHFGVLEEREGE